MHHQRDATVRFSIQPPPYSIIMATTTRTQSKSPSEQRPTLHRLIESARWKQIHELFRLAVLSLEPSDLVRHRAAIGLAGVTPKLDRDSEKALQVLESVFEEDLADADGKFETRWPIVDALWRIGRLETVATWLVKLEEASAPTDPHRGQIQLELAHLYFQTAQYELARRKIDGLQVETPESVWARRGKEFLNAFPHQLGSHELERSGGKR